MINRVAAAMAVVFLLGLFLARAFGEPFDTGLLNIATLIMGFFAWLATVVACATSKLPRSVWLTLLLVPVVLIACLLSAFRVVRVDGNLIPQFESRWGAEPVLPSEREHAADGPSIDAQKLTARTTDFPQFLGQDRDGVVRNVALATNWLQSPPQILWKQPIGAGWSAFAVQGDVAVTLEQRENEQWISAYDVNAGDLLWHHAVTGSHFNPLGGAGPRSTPTLFDNRVYAHTVEGQAVCLELASGNVVWKVDLLKLSEWSQTQAETKVSWGRSGSPLIVDDKVILPLGGPKPESGTLVALNRISGEVLWRGGVGQISYSSPALATLLGTRQIIIVNEATVSGHNPDDGQTLWQLEWSGQSNGPANVSQTIPVSDTQLLITKGYGQGSQLVQFERDAEGRVTLETVWRESSLMKTKFTSAVRLGDHAYGLSDGVLECINIFEGKRAWKNGRYKQGQVLLVGDVLLVLSESGEIVLVKADPASFQELARFPVLNGVTWNTPALSGDRLLIRNSDEAACIRLPLK